MRTPSGPDQKIFSARGQTVYLRGDVQDAGGTYRRLDQLNGRNFILGFSYGEHPDEPVATGDLEVDRELFRDALATEMQSSRLNKLGGVAQAADGKFRLLELNARVKIYAQLRPIGAPVDANGWNLIFDGVIDHTNAGPNPMKVSVSDLAVRLRRAWIKTERYYGIWQANTRLLQNTIVVPSPGHATFPNDPDLPGGPWYQAQGTGTTHATTEPVWPNVLNATVVDNGITWKCVAVAGGAPTGTPLEVLLQQILDDNLGVNAWTLYCPVSPVFLMRPGKVSGASVLNVLQDLADQCGWLVRWKWDNGTSQFRLTLYDPNRTNAVSSQTFPASKYKPVETFERDLDGVRTDVDVPFYNQGTADNPGNATPSVANSRNAGAEATFGDLYMALAEGATSAIDTLAEAQAMADAIQSDLSQPPIHTEIEVEYWPFQDLTDMVTLKADGKHADADLLCAVNALQHQIPNGGAGATKIGLRNKPSSGHYRWHEKAAAPGLNGGSLKISAPHAATALAALPTIAGAKITWKPPSSKGRRWDYTEVHIDTVSNFTPGPTKLHGTTRGTSYVFADLAAGTTYYVKVLHKDTRGNPSAASNQVSFVADFVQSVDIAAGAVLQANLEARLRQCFKRKVVAASSVGVSNGADFPAAFDTVVQDITGRSSSTGTFAPGADVFGDLRYHLHLRGPNITPGCSATVTLYAGAAAVAVSPRAFATDGPSSATVHQPEILIDAKFKHPFLAGTTYKVLLTIVDADGNAVTGCYLAAERGVAALAAVGRGASVHLGEQYLDPTGANGHVYRVTTANLTNAGAVVYSVADYFAQADGTAVLTEDGLNAPRVGSFFEFMPAPS